MSDSDKDVLKEIDLSKIITEHAKCLESVARFRSILSDFYPNYKKEINLLANAYEQDIWKQIKDKTEISKIEVGRLVNTLEDAYGIKQSYCIWAIETWAKAYGVKCDTQGYLKENVQQVNMQAQPIQVKTGIASNQTNAVAPSVPVNKNVAAPKHKKPKKQLDRKQKAGIIGGSAILVIVGIVVFINCLVLPRNSYNQALACMEEKNYVEAIAYFEEAEGYKDAGEKAAELQQMLTTEYEKGIRYQEAERYDEAIEIFRGLNDYSDATAKIEETQKMKDYDAAMQLLQAEEYTEASEAFQKLGDYQDAEAYYLEAVNGGKYKEAVELAANKQVAEAVAIFENLGTYKDSEQQVKEVEADYTSALNLMEKGYYEEAMTAFEKLGNYEESMSKLEEASNIYNYDFAVKKMNQGQYAEAAEAFEQLGDYQDSAQLKQEAKNAADYETAAKLMKDGDIAGAVEKLSTLGNYKDAKEQVDDIKAEYEKVQEYLNAGDSENAIALLEELGNYADSAELLAELTNADNYAEAVAYVAEGEYGKAISLFKKLGDYEDSKQQLSDVTNYSDALAYLENDKYAEAVKLLSDLGNYLDAKDRVEKIKGDYEKAQEYYTAKEYDSAIALFETLGNYEDSAELLGKLTNEDNYAKALAYVNAGNYDEAITLFKKLGVYEDSKQQLANVSDYRDALDYLENDKYAEAVQLLSGLGKYLDAEERVSTIETNYEEAKRQLKAENYDKAISLFASLGNYEDSEKQVKEVTNIKNYAAALAYLTQGKYSDAATVFKNLGNYSDSLQQYTNVTEYSKALGYLENGKQAEAVKVLSGLGNYLDAADKVTEIKEAYADAKKQLQNKNYDKAISLFTFLGNYEDSKGQLENIKAYCGALDNMKAGKHTEAVKTLTALGDYLDASEKVKEVENSYAVAMKLFENKEYVKALSAFEALGNYKESLEMPKKIEYARSYDKALDYMEEDDYDNAIQVLKQIKEYAPAAEKLDGLYSDSGYLAYLRKTWPDDMMAVVSSEVYAIKENGDLISTDKNAIEWKNVEKVVAANYRLFGVQKDGTIFIENGTQIYNDINLGKVREIEGLDSGDALVLTEEGQLYYITLQSGKAEAKLVEEGWTDIVDIEGWEISGGALCYVGVKKDGTVIKSENFTGDLAKRISLWSDIVDIEVSGSSYSSYVGIVGLTSDGSIVWGKKESIYYISYLPNFSKCEAWEGLVDIEFVGSTLLGLKADGTVELESYFSTDERKGWTDVVAVTTDHVLKSDGSVADEKGDLILNTKETDAEKKKKEKQLSNLRTLWPDDVMAVVSSEVYAIKENGDLISTDKNAIGWKNVEKVVDADGTLFGVQKDGTIFIERGTKIYNDINLGEVRDVEGFSGDALVLTEEGQLYYITLQSGKPEAKLLEEGWTDIVDIEGWQVSGGAICYVGVKKDGTVIKSENFTGDLAKRISLWSDIVDIEASGSSYSSYVGIVGLTSDGSIVWGKKESIYYISYLPNFSKCEAWEDLVDIEFVGSTLLGLKVDGTVELESYFSTDERKGWTDVVAVTTDYVLKSDGSVVDKNGKTILTGSYTIK